MHAFALCYENDDKSAYVQISKPEVDNGMTCSDSWQSASCSNYYVTVFMWVQLRKQLEINGYKLCNHLGYDRKVLQWVTQRKADKCTYRAPEGSHLQREKSSPSFYLYVFEEFEDGHFHREGLSPLELPIVQVYKQKIKGSINCITKMKNSEDFYF